MRGETRTRLTRKHPIAKNVLLGHRKVRFHFGLRNVGVGTHVLRCTGMATARTVGGFEVESVHHPAVVCGVEGDVRVVDIERRGQQRLLKVDVTPAGIEAGRYRIGTGQSVEKIVDRAVLLKDDDDVLDFATAKQPSARRAACGRYGDAIGCGSRQRRRRDALGSAALARRLGAAR